MEILTRNNEKVILKETEELQYEAINDTTELTAATMDLQGVKLLYMEPILFGLDSKDIAGVLLYFQMSDGSQKVLEILPDEFEPDKLNIALYK